MDSFIEKISLRNSIIPLSSLSLLAMMTLNGCAFTEGRPAAEASISVTPAFSVPKDRLISVRPDAFRTVKEFAVKLTSPIEVEADSVTLVLNNNDEEGGSKGFDPAHPPENVELCHNGHCHMKDGKLKTYAEVEAELGLTSGTSTTYTVTGKHIYTIDPKKPLDTKRILGKTFSSFACEPLPKGAKQLNSVCALPKDGISLIKLHITHIKFSSEVSDLTPSDRLGAPSISFNVDQSLIKNGEEGIDISVPVEDNLKMDKDVYQVKLIASVTPRLFDGLQASDYKNNQHTINKDNITDHGIVLSIQTNE